MNNLTCEQRALAEAMSEVSETAYCAGWMRDTEYDVWRLLHEGGTWGQANADSLAMELSVVRAALEWAGCWIVWDDEHEEQPVSLDQWRPMYEAWAVRTGRRAR